MGVSSRVSHVSHGAETGRGHKEVEGGGRPEGARGNDDGEELRQIWGARLWMALNEWRRILNVTLNLTGSQ